MTKHQAKGLAQRKCLINGYCSWASGVFHAAMQFHVGRTANCLAGLERRLRGWVRVGGWRERLCWRSWAFEALASRVKTRTLSEGRWGFEGSDPARENGPAQRCGLCSGLQVPHLQNGVGGWKHWPPVLQQGTKEVINAKSQHWEWHLLSTK